MKIRKLKLAALVLGLTLSFASVAQAQAHDRHIARSTDTITSSSAHSDGPGDSGFSLGMSSYSGIGVPSLAMLISMGHGHHLQLNLTLPNTSPFTFMGGAIYKYYLMEHSGYGFHIGGGGLFGSNNSAFAMTAGGVAGFHFPFPGTNNQVTFHFDAGPVVNVAGGQASFSLAPLSSLLGVTVFYTF